MPGCCCGVLELRAAQLWRGYNKPGGYALWGKDFIKRLAVKTSLDETCLAAAGSSLCRAFSFETPLKGIPAATVLLSWPEGAFMCTDLELSPQEIVDLYGRRWKIAALFRDAETKLGLDSHMLHRRRP
jgi:hypothetical protein